jgi:hypothetical protein
MCNPIPSVLSLLILFNWLLASKAAPSLGLLRDPEIQRLRACVLMRLQSSIDDICPKAGCICQLDNLASPLHPVNTDACRSIDDATAAMAAVISHRSVHSYTLPSDLASIITPGAL